MNLAPKPLINVRGFLFLNGAIDQVNVYKGFAMFCPPKKPFRRYYDHGTKSYLYPMLMLGDLIYFYKDKLILPISSTDEKWAYMDYNHKNGSRYKFKTKKWVSNHEIITVITMNIPMGPARQITPEDAQSIRREWAMATINNLIHLSPLDTLEKFARYLSNLPEKHEKRKK